MNVSALSSPIVRAHDDLFGVLASTLPQLHECDVVVVTSKIIALCEGEVVSSDACATKEQKHELVRRYAEQYIEPHSSKYNIMLTIKHHILAVNAGIDESNVESGVVLWPKDPQASANMIWRWIRKTYHLKEVGVIISDSKTFPLKWGVIGTALAHCGFVALADKRGSADIFGRELKITQVNVAEALAVAGVFAMGEADEQTPLALVRDIPHIQFSDQEPTDAELTGLVNILEDDAYAPVLQSAEWKVGGGGKDMFHNA